VFALGAACPLAFRQDRLGSPGTCMQVYPPGPTAGAGYPELLRRYKVPVDGQGRMRPEGLPPLSGLSIVCAQAGNVNTGAFDPLHEICQHAHQAGAWVHVDGDFGLWAAATPALAHLSAGVAEADSWATDAHK
jgi:hypothetical protein